MKKLLAAMFVALLMVGWGCDDSRETLGDVANGLGLAKIREAEVNGTTELDLNMAFFGKDLTRLKGLTNLKKLHLSFNEITDLTPLKGLTNLEYLNLSLNEITDLSPLAGLTNLTWLDLSSNKITDVTPLAGLTNLETLHLGIIHEITDVTPLAGLTNLEKLQLGVSLCPRDQIEMLKKALPDCIIE